jgi:predicted amidophosphoribosyltransferase
MLINICKQCNKKIATNGEICNICIEENNSDTKQFKCKHCKYFKYQSLLKKDGTKSRVKKAFCTNHNSNMFGEQLTLKSKICNKFKL